ncbi:MAG: bifunctional hydroxymethylpyrimidine kinase/phosphomethylpyrimidine kinase [Verrucomicrobia bacterium]|nr:MAG: bifunctional hydroxymethylpyrimidine kinase/phosphomethylpyrimidine kinase [Verrucomicrobiota bacterium]
MSNKNARRSQSAATTVALTVAGSDSSAGAGAQADLKTFTALGVYGLTAITCIVAETPGKVSRIQPADPEIVRVQIELSLKSFPVAGIKTGLLCNAEIVAQVVRSLRKVKGCRVVVDPVIVATTGDALLAPEAIEIYERELFPLATLLTPNLDEAARLLGDSIRDLAAMHRAARALAKKYGTAVLLKGGHLRGRRAIDVLSSGNRTREFSALFVPDVKTHGTGCTYSAAITAELAKGVELSRAIATAKKFVSSAIRSHFVWKFGHGKIFALNPSCIANTTAPASQRHPESRRHEEPLKRMARPRAKRDPSPSARFRMTAC